LSSFERFPAGVFVLPKEAARRSPGDLQSCSNTSCADPEKISPNGRAQSKNSRRTKKKIAPRFFFARRSFSPFFSPVVRFFPRFFRTSLQMSLPSFVETPESKAALRDLCTALEPCYPERGVLIGTNAAAGDVMTFEKEGSALESVLDAVAGAAERDGGARDYDPVAFSAQGAHLLAKCVAFFGAVARGVSSAGEESRLCCLVVLSSGSWRAVVSPCESTGDLKFRRLANMIADYTRPDVVEFDPNNSLFDHEPAEDPSAAAYEPTVAVGPTAAVGSVSRYITPPQTPPRRGRLQQPQCPGAPGQRRAAANRLLRHELSFGNPLRRELFFGNPRANQRARRRTSLRAIFTSLGARS
jgi:hypothetical protein